jgi:hypothetical protein
VLAFGAAAGMGRATRKDQDIAPAARTKWDAIVRFSRFGIAYLGWTFEN